jgi:peptidoglycan/xylan/chitin deacetylase (PgdA/CDA1 family)
MDLIKSIIKWLLYHGGAFLLYHVGALPLYHRLRNRHVLTVAMFHRVLSRKDPRWNSALPDWTLAEDVFEDCLSFFMRHYTVVGQEEVMASLHAKWPLPSRSLLLTFDDGFADNEEYALPILRRLGLPAAEFITSDCIGRKNRLWTEDFLWDYHRGQITQEEVASVYHLIPTDIPRSTEDTLGMVEEIKRRGPQLSEPEVLAALAQLHKPHMCPGTPAQMLNAGQVRTLAHHGVAIGAHGKTHVALPFATDLTAELRQPRRVIEDLLASEPQRIFNALALPYGDGTPDIIDRAIEEGYQLVFTTQAELLPLPCGYLPTPVIGRINVSGPALAPHGRLRPELLALEFFRRPHARLK